MSTLPLEVHEVLEEEYRAMYDAEPERVDYATFEILEDQEGWARSILLACGVKRDKLQDAAAIVKALEQFVDGGCPEGLDKSPVISENGRAVLKAYASYLKEETDKRRLNRRLVDDALCGAIRPFRDMKLSKLYRALHDLPDDQARTALCISGGGIRSATFALGVIQGLASAKLLDKFHYLSTVSGGGYIGSWLSSWIRRHPKGVDGVQDDLARADSAAVGPEKKFPQSAINPEPQPLSHLRDYSNYLSPKLGITSGDTWSLVALYLRNLLLNLLVLIPLLACGLAVPRFFSLLLRYTAEHHATQETLLGVMLGFLAVGFGYLGFTRPVLQGGKKKRWALGANSSFILGCILPLTGAATALAIFWARQAARDFAELNEYLPEALFALALMTALPFLLYYARYIRASAAERRAGLTRQGPGHTFKKIGYELVAVTVGALTAGGLFLLSAAKIFPDPMRKVVDLAGTWPFLRPLTDSIPEAQLYICFAVPLVLLIFYVQASVFVGLTATVNEDDDREWWGRAGAFLLLFAAGLGVASIIAVLGPVFLYKAPVLVGSIGGFSGIAAALFGFSAKTPATNKDKEQPQKGSSIMNAVSALAVPLFVVVALAGISLGTTWLLQQFNDRGVDPAGVQFAGQFAAQATITEQVPHGKQTYEVKKESAKIVVDSLPVARGIAHLKTIEATNGKEARGILAAALGAFVLSFMIGANKFSMHALYRNRLIRAYLGASRYTRDPDRFTGFDENDNLQMFQLRPELVWVNTFKSPKELVKQLLDSVDGKSTTAQKQAVAKQVWDRLGRWSRKRLVRDADLTAGLRDQLILCINAVLLDVDLAPLAPDVKTTKKSFLARNREIFEALFPAIGSVKDRGPIGPLHVVNTALNLTSGSKLAWQQRQAESFTVSPLHCGSVYLGYRSSRRYGGDEGISIGTAVTISGAAASPNQGYHSSPALAFLLTLLNVRLGWWLGNPGIAGRRTHRRGHPYTNVNLLFKEATGQSNDQYGWVYLSDGGHFENLGVYEMVLRRCRYIVVSDAGCDPKFTFEDLGNAIRKIRTDLGVPVDIEHMYMLPRTANDAMFPDGRYVATAKIRYSAIDSKATDGKLIYIKPGLYSEEYFPKDVFNYARSSSDFPHETTADQFFSESQFESYRALGRHVVNEICGNYSADETKRLTKTTTYGSVAVFAEKVTEAAKRIARKKAEDVVAGSLEELKLTIKEVAAAASGAKPEVVDADRFDRLMIALRRPRKST